MVLGLAHLQCSSIKLREAPPVARSTGEVSRNKCMHCRVDTAWGGGQQVTWRMRMQVLCM